MPKSPLDHALPMSDEGPYAIGDQVKTMSSATDICLYGSAWVGMLASIVAVSYTHLDH